MTAGELTSVIHRMNPAVKLILFVLMMQMAAGIRSTTGILISGLSGILLLYLAKIPYNDLFKKFKPFAIILVFTLIINLFFGENLNDSALIAYRFLMIILLSVVLTMTTLPEKLIGVILIPFRGKFGQNLKVVTLVALRFIPVFIDEVKDVASSIRNMPEYESKPYTALIKPELYLTPLIANMIEHSEAVAESIDDYKTEKVDLPKAYEVMILIMALVVMVKYDL